MGFELTIAEGKGRGQRFVFDGDDVTIGRGAGNEVVLNDSGVSRNHARIQRQGRGWQLLDNGSANGTELNGVVIAGATLLRNGDRVGVGPISFTFRADREAKVVMPAAGAAGDDTRITGQPAKGAPRGEETRVSALPVQSGARSVAPRAGGAPGSEGGPLPLLERFAALPVQARAAALGAVVLLLALLAYAWASGQKPKGTACPETVAVDDEVAGFSFGRGVVDVDCGDKVQFGFSVPSRTRVLFHYLATRVAQPSEVELKLNGKHLSWAPVAAARGEPQVLSVPDELLAADGRNVVAFTESQKGKEWSVGKVRVEFLAVTPGDLKAAQALYERGRRKLGERKVAPRNLYDAWKNFVAARRALEGLSPKPPIYDEVAQLIKDAERDLDKECQRLLFVAARFDKYGQDDKAQQTWREVLMHFPGEEPAGCRKKAQENIVSTPVAQSGEE